MPSCDWESLFVIGGTLLLLGKPSCDWGSLVVREPKSDQGDLVVIGRD